MTRLAILVTIIVMAAACSWRDCARATAYAVGSTVVLATGNGDAYGFNENYGGQAAADLVDALYDASNATD